MKQSSEQPQRWFHGSPHKLEVLRPGSTITPRRRLARIFSHKPTLVSMEDDGSILHDGILPGYLYRIDEPVAPGDVRPHPRSAMDPDLEWLTTRPLKLCLLGRTEIRAEERLTEERKEALFSRARGEGSQVT